MIAFWDLGGIRLHSGSGPGGVEGMTLVDREWWMMMVKEEDREGGPGGDDNRSGT